MLCWGDAMRFEGRLTTRCLEIEVNKGLKMVRKVLLICGILASLVYVGSDIVAAMRWEGYSFTSQAVSELRALGSPTRAFLLPILFIYGVLELAFGLGVWGAAGQKRGVRIAGGLLIALAMVDLVIAPFFPMNVRENMQQGVNTLTDTMHIILTAVTVLLIFSIIGFGSSADGKWFRFYSLATLLIVLVGGALAGQEGAKLAAQQPTPWLGVMERINIYGYMLWLMVLAIVLLRGHAVQPQDHVGGRPPDARLPHGQTPGHLRPSG